MADYSVEPILFFLFTFALSAALTASAIKVARRLRLYSHPVERSSHSIPTPQVGGIGICLSFLLVLFVLPNRFFEIPESLFDTTSGFWSMPRTALIFMVLLGFGVGVLDDIYHYSAKKKIGALLLLAALPLGWGVSLEGFGFEEHSGWHIGVVLGGVLAVGWIFFFINAFNFMDGVNGQSGLFALNALAWWVVYWLLLHEFIDYDEFEPIARLGLLVLLGLAGAVLGFLVWNFPKAVTFLGDSGSLPLGAILAVLPLTLAIKNLDLLIAHGLALLPFVYDVIYTLLRRLRRRENVFVAHRSHLYQRLLIATGWSHTRLLAFHLPYFLLCGLIGFFYYTSMLGRHYTEELAAIEPFLSVALVRVSCTAAVVGVAGFYTALVLTIEKSKTTQENHS